LPTPSSEETLSSWLFRCSINPNAAGFPRLSSTERPAYWWEGVEIKYSDPDSEFLSASQRLSCVAGDITPELLRNFFCLRGDKLVEWRYRRFFFPDFLRDDVANGRLPIWRKDWCYIYSCVCAAHDRELVRLVDTPRYSRAWDAFVQSCNSISNNASIEETLFFRFCSSTFTKIEHALISRDNQQPTLHDLFYRLFNIFLQCPFRGSRGGIARIHLQTRKDARAPDASSFEQSILLGASTADPSSRFGSLVLTASLLEIIPYSRFLIFTKLCEKRRGGMLIPRDLHKAAIFPYINRAGYETLYRFLGGFPRKDFPLLDRHLQLQEHSYVQDGVLGKRLFGYSQ
jgi:hypothetical protein